MHEMSYVVRVVNLALKKKEEQGCREIEKVVIQIGQMVGVEPYYMKKYYLEAVKGTELEGSDIECEILPVIAKCEQCGLEYHPDKSNDYMCPGCGSGAAKTVQGREFILKEIHALC